MTELDKLKDLVDQQGGSVNIPEAATHMITAIDAYIAEKHKGIVSPMELTQVSVAVFIALISSAAQMGRDVHIQEYAEAPPPSHFAAHLVNTAQRMLAAALPVSFETLDKDAAK